MVINLENLFNNDGEILEVNTELDFSENEVSGVKPFVSPVKVKGNFVNNTGIVSIKAVAEFMYSAPCDRCATQVERKMTVPIEHFFAVSLNNDNNDDYILVEDMRLDFDELIYSDVYLSLPTKFLCKEDCKGLCSICGKNLNIAPCDCKKPMDSRWAVLSQLLEDDDE
ncbi:MAG: DUF177 domain-containing protein [Clostridiales bacterium]|nr:DUF177 domain-containing protein [Clostridiales bacterium]